MVTLILIISLICICWGSDWEQSERAKDQRHHELMEAQKKRDEQYRQSQKRTRKCTRTVAKDVKGNVIAQETIEE